MCRLLLSCLVLIFVLSSIKSQSEPSFLVVLGLFLFVGCSSWMTLKVSIDRKQSDEENQLNIDVLSAKLSAQVEILKNTADAPTSHESVLVRSNWKGPEVSIDRKKADEENQLKIDALSAKLSAQAETLNNIADVQASYESVNKVSQESCRQLGGSVQGLMGEHSDMNGSINSFSNEMQRLSERVSQIQHQVEAQAAQLCYLGKVLGEYFKQRNDDDFAGLPASLCPIL